jgi:hypothetical protein
MSEASASNPVIVVVSFVQALAKRPNAQHTYIYNFFIA